MSQHIHRFNIQDSRLVSWVLDHFVSHGSKCEDLEVTGIEWSHLCDTQLHSCCAGTHPLCSSTPPCRYMGFTCLRHHEEVIDLPPIPCEHRQLFGSDHDALCLFASGMLGTAGCCHFCLHITQAFSADVPECARNCPASPCNIPAIGHGLRCAPNNFCTRTPSP